MSRRAARLRGPSTKREGKKVTEEKALVKAKAEDVRSFLMRDSVKEQLKLALPRHLTPDRLLRVALTAILRTPGLMNCTKESLLSCIMTAAQLGLEPDQFLGQAYLIPFHNNKKGVMECQLMPGYRGYIALARRSGEVQSVSSQVVYSKDKFTLRYGLEETLDHFPAEGERGEPKGAYVVFHYKDGSRSFDYMSKPDIERIRKRSKSANNGPWVTDWDEMAKKTVIKRHSKLAPMSVEFSHARQLEERALAGKSQVDLFFGATDETLIEAAQDPEEEVTDNSRQEALDKFNSTFPPLTSVGEAHLKEFISLLARANRCTEEDVKVQAAENSDVFWKGFEEYEQSQKIPDPPVEPPQPEPPPAQNHAAADAAISEADRKREQKIAEKKSKNKPPQEMVECPEYGKHHGRQVAVIYCQTQCDNKECDLSPARERQPGEENE
ncbi:MAG: recombinase RecT [Candidatus Omnitrophota bacterium]